MSIFIDWNAAISNRNGRVQTSGAKLTNYTMKDGRTQACLTIYEDAMKRMRWAIGDRLMFAPGDYNGRPIVGIRRVQAGGRAISPASSSKGLSERLAGRSVAGACRWSTEVFALYSGSAPNKDLIETDDGALIMFLEQNKPET